MNKLNLQIECKDKIPGINNSECTRTISSPQPDIFAFKSNTMKKSMFIGIVISFLYVTTYAQSTLAIRSNSRNQTIDCNDSTFMRILNGRVIPNNYSVSGAERIRLIREQNDINELGIKSNKPIMLLEFQSSNLKAKIDSALYSQPKFIEQFNLPLDIKLPISVNGKLLTMEEENALSSNVKFSEIKDLKYISPKKTKYLSTPFGVINVIL